MKQFEKAKEMAYMTTAEGFGWKKEKEEEGRAFLITLLEGKFPELSLDTCKAKLAEAKAKRLYQ